MYDIQMSISNITMYQPGIKLLNKFS